MVGANGGLVGELIQSLTEGVERELARRLCNPREASLISCAAHFGIFVKMVLGVNEDFGESDEECVARRSRSRRSRSRFSRTRCNCKASSRRKGLFLGGRLTTGVRRDLGGGLLIALNIVDCISELVSFQSKLSPSVFGRLWVEFEKDSSLDV